MSGAAAQPKPDKFESDTAFFARLDAWQDLKCTTCDCDQAVHQNKESGNVLGDVCWGCFYEYPGGEAPPLGWKHQHRFES